MSKKTQIVKLEYWTVHVPSKKVQIAKLILSMTSKERSKMASEIVDLQSNAADDGSGFSLDNKMDVTLLLREWAKGLGGME